MQIGVKQTKKAFGIVVDVVVVIIFLVVVFVLFSNRQTDKKMEWGPPR